MLPSRRVCWQSMEIAARRALVSGCGQVLYLWWRADAKREGELELIQGRWPRFGTDEVVVGRPLTTRMKDCRVGDTLMLNVTPFAAASSSDSMAESSSSSPV